MVRVSSHALDRLSLRYGVRITKKNRTAVVKELARQVKVYREKHRLPGRAFLFVGDRFPVVGVREGTDIVVATVLTWQMAAEKIRQARRHTLAASA